jgi:hypothetical protein
MATEVEGAHFLVVSQLTSGSIETKFFPRKKSSCAELSKKKCDRLFIRKTVFTQVNKSITNRSGRGCGSTQHDMHIDRDDFVHRGVLIYPCENPHAHHCKNSCAHLLVNLFQITYGQKSRSKTLTLRHFKRALICPILIAGTQVMLEKVYFSW